MTMSRLDILMKKIDTMQSALGVKGAAKPSPVKKKGRLSEFEKALLVARNKLKETEDKIDERTHKVEVFGMSSRERIECDIAIEDLLKQSGEAIRDLEKSMAPLRKKLASQSPAIQEEFKQKDKLVNLIKEQFYANKNNFENNEIVTKRRADPNAGVLANKIVLIGDKGVSRDLTGEEQEALERFKKKDEQIDDMLVLVIQDIDLLKEKATHIDHAIERNQQNLENVGKHAEKTATKLETINTKMKDVLRKYAQPSRMCLYVVLLLIAIGLFMVMYNQFKTL